MAFFAGDCTKHLLVSSVLSICPPVTSPDVPPRFEPWNSILLSAHNIDVAVWSLCQLGSSDQIVPGLILLLLTQYCSGIKIEKNHSKKLLAIYSLGSICSQYIYVVFLFNTVICVFLLLRLCILIVCLCIFIAPAGTFRLPRLRYFRAFPSVVTQMPGYNPQRRGTAGHTSRFLCCSKYCFFCVVLCTVCVSMCTVLLPPGGYPTAVNKYIISYQ